jgi:hypothetical protein
MISTRLRSELENIILHALENGATREDIDDVADWCVEAIEDTQEASNEDS